MMIAFFAVGFATAVVADTPLLQSRHLDKNIASGGNKLLRRQLDECTYIGAGPYNICVLEGFPYPSFLTIFTGCPPLDSFGSVADCGGGCIIVKENNYVDVDSSSEQCIQRSLCGTALSFDCPDLFAGEDCTTATCGDCISSGGQDGTGGGNGGNGDNDGIITSCSGGRQNVECEDLRARSRSCLGTQTEESDASTCASCVNSVLDTCSASGFGSCGEVSTFFCNSFQTTCSTSCGSCADAIEADVLCNIEATNPQCGVLTCGVTDGAGTGNSGIHERFCLAERTLLAVTIITTVYWLI